MAKGKDTQKAVKKKPGKTLKEKRKEKKEKKDKGQYLSCPESQCRPAQSSGSLKFRIM